MKRVTRTSAVSVKSASRFLCPHAIPIRSTRCFHTTPPNPADVAPLTASAPPPPAPVPSAEHAEARIARRRKQAELLQRGQDLRATSAGKPGSPIKSKRFWKDVRVVKVDGEDRKSHSLSTIVFDPLGLAELLNRECHC